MPAVTDTPITLKGGFVVRTSVCIWLIDASFRLTFEVVNDQLEVRPKRGITVADDLFIRAHREELVAAVRYCDEQDKAPL
jgi:hypothetical protein